MALVASDRRRATGAINAWLLAAVFSLGLATALGALFVRGAPRDLGLGASGTLHAVMLSNQQVYYGTLDKVTQDAVVFKDVFYVAVSSDAQGNRVNKLVRRSENDWHGPEQMSIPIDKILFVEVVGPSSGIAKLVNEARSKK